MDSQQLVDTASQNSQDIVLPKPASSTPRHSIDAILGLANNKRTHQEMEDNARDAQENTGNVRLLRFVLMPNLFQLRGITKKFIVATKNRGSFNTCRFVTL